MHSRLVLCSLGFSAVVPSAFSQVGNFDSMNSYTAPLELRLNEIRGVSGVAAMEGVEKHTVFADYAYMTGDFDQEAGRFERDFHTHSGRLGYGHRMGAFRIGAMAALQGGEIDAREINAEVPEPATAWSDTDGWLGALFAGYDAEALSLLVVGGFGSADNSIERSSDLGPTFGHSFARFDTDSTFAAITARGHLSSGERFVWSPYLTLGHIEVEADGSTESGGPDRRIIDAYWDRQNYVQLGLELTTGDVWYAPVLHVGWWRDFADQQVEIGVRAAEGTFLGVLEVPDAYRELVLAGIRFDGEIGPGWWAEFRADYAASSDTRIANIGVGLSRRY